MTPAREACAEESRALVRLASPRSTQAAAARWCPSDGAFVDPTPRARLTFSVIFPLQERSPWS